MTSFILDLRTLALMAMISALGLFFGTVFIWRLDKTERSLRYWAAGAGTMAFGMLLVAMRGLLPDVVTVVIGNTLVVASFSLLYLGARGLLGAPRVWPWNWLVVLLVGIAMVYYSEIQPNVGLRLGSLALGYVALLLGCAWLFWRHGGGRMVIVERTSSALFLVGAGLFVASGAAAVGALSSSRTAVFLEWVLVMPYMYATVFNLWLGILLTLTLSDRVQHQLALARDRAESARQQLAQANRELEVLSVTDKLTALFNRVKLDRVLTAELARAHRYGSALSVVMLDIDHFKVVNDPFGHNIGDDVLVDIADTLRVSVRNSDTVGRWGGEEFLVILPSTDLDQAGAVAEKVRGRVADLKLPTVGQVTVSLGVAEYQAGDTEQQLVARADIALYAAKEGGRNRVCQDVRA
ncbi:MAG: two-component system, cell cycle response regulator [Actinomycetota bacterium]|nr:two-component system, cell cycle response regulator [Actinomycetota bacterium]